MLNIVLFGPPGAGKGTQAEKLIDKYELVHLSTGDILRNNLLQKDIISKKLKDIMSKGQLVSNEILNEVISNRINEDDCRNGFILDGYPRTKDQAIFLKSILDSKDLNIDKIFDINLDLNIIVKRIKSRSDIENRDDDKEEIIKTRMLKYQSETKPVSDYFKAHQPFDYKTIDGNQNIKKINGDIIKILKNDLI